MNDNLTIPELTQYLENLIRIEMKDQPYTFNLLEGTIHTLEKDYRIIIPPIIVNDIRLEEL